GRSTSMFRRLCTRAPRTWIDASGERSGGAGGAFSVFLPRVFRTGRLISVASVAGPWCLPARSRSILPDPHRPGDGSTRAGWPGMMVPGPDPMPAFHLGWASDRILGEGGMGDVCVRHEPDDLSTPGVPARVELPGDVAQGPTDPRLGRRRLDSWPRSGDAG